MTSLKDTTRLIPPTLFWAHTHYGNDLGTLYWEKRPITAVPEYTNPDTTYGSQDAVVGYGALCPTSCNQLYFN